VKFVLDGGVAVLTGAASGIGRATALALAGRGCHLALVDRDAEGLVETARRITARRVRVSQHVLDVTDDDAVLALPEAVLTEHGRVTILINNAGVSLVGRFEEVTMAEFRWLIEINFLAVVVLTKVFLPILLQQKKAQIVNISSLFGIIAPAEQTAYVAAKFAVRGFSESLRHNPSQHDRGARGPARECHCAAAFWNRCCQCVERRRLPHRPGCMGRLSRPHTVRYPERHWRRP
jgi:short-subunit dehydrogenase